MRMENEVVRLNNVTVSFNGETILKRINFVVREDDYIGIIGPNGGGKTTLLKVILGLVSPDEGEISILGESPEKGRRHIGYVPQFAEFDRAFPISVWDTVLMGRLSQSSPFRRFDEEDKAKAEESLKKVRILGLKDRQMGSLSGGERQRIYIARALTTDPKILLLDEPTASIDVEMEAGFYELLNDLRKNVAIVLVSHDISVISVHVDRIACLNRELYVHDSTEIDADILEKTYKCPVEMIAHGVPHRVLREHTHKSKR